LSCVLENAACTTGWLESGCQVRLIPRGGESLHSLDKLRVPHGILFPQPQHGERAIRSRFDDALHFVRADLWMKVNSESLAHTDAGTALTAVFKFFSAFGASRKSLTCVLVL